MGWEGTGKERYTPGDYWSWGQWRGNDFQGRGTCEIPVTLHGRSTDFYIIFDIIYSCHIILFIIFQKNIFQILQFSLNNGLVGIHCKFTS